MPITDSLVARYRFENAANLGQDSIGANDLANNNVATQGAGKVGGGLALLAASSQYLSLASNADLQLGGGAWEITAWVYPTALTTSRAIVSKWSGAKLEYYFYWEASNSQFTIAIKSSWDASLIFLGTGIAAVALNRWYWLDAYQDPAGNAGAGILAIAQDNGVPGLTVGLGPANDTQAFWIGAQSDGSAYWDGRIDEVNVYKRLLTSAERTTYFNAGSRRRAMSCTY